jgi:type IV secretory pathway TrbD component
VSQRQSQRATTRPVHAALVRPELTLGVERHVAGVEATLCFALLCSQGIGIGTVGVVAFVVAFVHPVMVWLTAKDPQATQVFARSRRYADFYAPHSAEMGTRTPRPSIPKVR